MIKKCRLSAQITYKDDTVECQSRKVYVIAMFMENQCTVDQKQIKYKTKFTNVQKKK